jgi:uncharacterized caspase-like protein
MAAKGRKQTVATDRNRPIADVHQMQLSAKRERSTEIAWADYTGVKTPRKSE